MAEVCIFTFSSTHFALKAENLAEEAGISVRMIPVPRELSADCNMGMETSPRDEVAAKQLLADADVEHNVVRWNR